MNDRETQSTDREMLVARARCGERAAFDALVDPLRERLSKRVGARLGERVGATLEADDIVQETLLKAWNVIDRLEWRGDEAFFRWLATLAEHLIWSASKRRTMLFLEPTVADAKTGGDTSAGREMDREERARRLEKALAKLSPAHREVIVLTRIEGLRIAEAAVRIGRSANATGKLLAYALAELAHHYGPDSGSLRLPGQSVEIGDTHDDR